VKQTIQLRFLLPFFPTAASLPLRVGPIGKEVVVVEGHRKSCVKRRGREKGRLGDQRNGVGVGGTEEGRRRRFTGGFCPEAA